MDKDAILKGTTTVGLVCSDGVVFAADKRATMGYFIANREVNKISKIDDAMAMTIAGSVADAQALTRIIRAEIQLYKLRSGKPMSVTSAASILSNLMFQYKVFPFYVQLLVGGVDDSPKIFNLDPIGGVTEETVVSTGSGSPIAYGLLEDEYVPNKPVKDNLKLGLRAVGVAMKRDCASGDGVDLVTITKTSVRKHKKEEIKKLLDQVR
ncbi:MAG: archaeal proteasome endopeptidase complex subunit beta [Candidatus Micrarchaeota archaeon]